MTCEASSPDMSAGVVMLAIIRKIGRIDPLLGPIAGPEIIHAGVYASRHEMARHCQKWMGNYKEYNVYTKYVSLIVSSGYAAEVPKPLKI